MTDIVYNHDYLDNITAVIGILETNMIYYFVNTVLSEPGCSKSKLQGEKLLNCNKDYITNRFSCSLYNFLNALL